MSEPLANIFGVVVLDVALSGYPRRLENPFGPRGAAQLSELILTCSRGELDEMCREGHASTGALAPDYRCDTRGPYRSLHPSIGLWANGIFDVANQRFHNERRFFVVTNTSPI